MNSRKVDLNLFRVFEAVMKHRSVVGAGHELHLTPSAVSHALGRLREVLADNLFVATPDGMAPTARALALAPHVRAGLERIDDAVSVERFDPATTVRAFRIAATDYGTATVMPALLARLQTLAPQLDFQVFPFNRVDSVRQLEDGRIDLALSWFNELPGHLRRLPLRQDSEAVIARSGHPLLQGEITKERLLAYPHVVVELTGSGAPAGSDGYLDERGVSRRVWIERLLLDLRQDGQPLVGRAAVSVPHYASAIPLVAASDMLATLPHSLAQAATRHAGVVQLPLPYAPLTATLEAIWHQHGDSDAGLQWLLAQMAQAVNPAHP